MISSRGQLLSAVQSCLDDLREVSDDPDRLLAAAQALARLDAASETDCDRVVAACLAKAVARVVARDIPPRGGDLYCCQVCGAAVHVTECLRVLS